MMGVSGRKWGLVGHPQSGIVLLLFVVLCPQVVDWIVVGLYVV